MAVICHTYGSEVGKHPDRWHPGRMLRRTDPIAHQLASLGFARAAAEQLSHGGTIIAVAAGGTLCREGERGLEAFLILDGEAQVLLADRVVPVGPGEVVGELAALDRTRTRNATVVAGTDLLVLVFDVRTFGALADVPALRSALRPERVPA